MSALPWLRFTTSKMRQPLTGLVRHFSLFENGSIPSKKVLVLPAVNQVQIREKGHSKWQNIKATKESKDQEFGKLCMRYSAKIGVSIRENGNENNPDRNRTLAKLIQEAKAQGNTRS